FRSVLAREAGVPGVVASAQDVEAIRAACGKDFVVVTPGIRREGKDAVGDQKRIATPYGAVAAGADYLVVGRPIRTAADPAKEADEIVDEIAEGLAAYDGKD
ncbi:MAG: orotidine 5'-phosphate decarboxylase, partial [Smithellaceae bacterium]|nr:orotidine 5'-phosphate decarboxylase [Smithellaceae bacterium]